MVRKGLKLMKAWIREIILGFVILLLSGNAKVLYDISQDLKANTVIIEEIQEDMEDIEQDVEAIDEDLDEIHDWKAATSASRFTAEDGRDVWGEIRAIQLDIAVIRSEMVNHNTHQVDQ